MVSFSRSVLRSNSSSVRSNTERAVSHPTRLNSSIIHGSISSLNSSRSISNSLTSGPITVEFSVTKDAKYSVQIVPFGAEDPIKTFGFTADASVVTKTYDLSSLPNGDYTLIFIDIVGKEIKQQITIKK